MHTPKHDTNKQPFANDRCNNDVARAAEVVKEKRLVDAALLYLVSHRPLSFTASQLLYALQPLANLLDFSTFADYAELLNDPDRITQLLTSASEDASAQNHATPAKQDQDAAHTPVKVTTTLNAG